MWRFNVVVAGTHHSQRYRGQGAPAAVGGTRALNDRAALEAFLANREIVGLVTDELNVRALRAVDDVAAYVSMTATPNFPVLGEEIRQACAAGGGGDQVGSRPAVAQCVRRQRKRAHHASAMRRSSWDARPVRPGRCRCRVRAAQERGLTVILNLAISEELRLEGLAREIVNRLQNLRKSAGLDVTDRIRVRYEEGEPARRVFARREHLIAPRRSPWRQARCDGLERHGDLRSRRRISDACGLRNLVDRGGGWHYLSFALAAVFSS
jgi:hypothetical protein